MTTTDIGLAAATMISNIISADAYIISSSIVPVIQYPNELTDLLTIEADPANNIVIKNVDWVTTKTGLDFDYKQIKLNVECISNTRTTSYTSQQLADQIMWALNRYNASQDSNTGSFYTPHITVKSDKNFKQKKNADVMSNMLEITMPVFVANL
jgi:hypothetical protein